MDRRSSVPEGLPPLELSVLRELDLEEAPVPGVAAHVSSASGVARRGDYVYVIGDDMLGLGVFRYSQERPGALRAALAGEEPTDPEERAKRKADLEALTLLPPFEGHPYGSLLGLGSGSGGRERDRGFVWALAPDGSLLGEPDEIDLSPVYDALRETAPDLNIEGAAALGDRLWLFQRGNTDQGLNIVAELELDAVLESLHTDRRLDAVELASVRAYDLGALDGVPLTFSDATPLADELVVFTASAENSGDGAIRGSVVGTIDADGHVERLRTIDRRWKVEGVYASIDARVIDFLFVCDQDDPDTASPLLSASMPIDARYEAQG
jgi:hypothetical protein